MVDDADVRSLDELVHQAVDQIIFTNERDDDHQSEGAEPATNLKKSRQF